MTKDSGPMLEIKRLSVSIHGAPILEELSLTVRAGEVAAIMGPNGSGKSTLSYVIAGKPDYEVVSGEIWLDGENLLELEPSERAAASAGRRRPDNSGLHASGARGVASLKD
jgi:Fe-S cluster assembly ATP-binding protein